MNPAADTVAISSMAVTPIAVERPIEGLTRGLRIE